MTVRSFPNGAAYGASKSGIVQLTRALKQAWSRHGVNCNAIAPGFFPTELTAPVFNDPARATEMAQRTMIGRNGVLDDLRGATVDWEREIDMRKLTLSEITLVGTYTYSMADLRATVRSLEAGVYGELGWVEERPLKEGAAAFADLDQGKSGAAKIVLRP